MVTAARMHSLQRRGACIWVLHSDKSKVIIVIEVETACAGHPTG